jgi:hypothetical protein
MESSFLAGNQKTAQLPEISGAAGLPKRSLENAALKIRL